MHIPKIANKMHTNDVFDIFINKKVAQIQYLSHFV